MKYLSECDLIVYDLHYGNPLDVRLALDALKKHKSEDEKVLILVSSLMAWQGTPKKLELIRAAGDQEPVEDVKEKPKIEVEANEEGGEE